MKTSTVSQSFIGSRAVNCLARDAQQAPFAPANGVPHAADLPANLVLLEQAGGILRSYLAAHGLQDWHCFFPRNTLIHRVDEHLEALGESDAHWVPAGSFTPGGHQIIEYTFDDDTDTCHPAMPGYLQLKGLEVILFRWLNPAAPDQRMSLELIAAAPSVQHLDKLIADLIKLDCASGKGSWQVVGSACEHALPRKAGKAIDDLVLPATVLDRLNSEVVDFFSVRTQKLYADLHIPHRRGVLLHGPPGNGKTSIIRALGGMLDSVAALLLRPGRNFDDDFFDLAIRRWVSRAPAILVIEDLDWLLPKMNLSTFLNQMDGIDQRDGGLLLIATTNHPGELDPAVNNRPGRFDVVIEIPSPGESHRLDYLRQHSLQTLPDGLLAEIAAATDGLSFAHLREIESLSGLIALRSGRNIRAADDVREAMRIVTATHAQARRGFPERRKTVGFAGQDNSDE